jgi:hypothetical protein
MDEPRRRLMTRLIVLLMIASAAWGGWLIAKNDGRRGRIGPPPKTGEPQDKNTQTFNFQRFIKQPLFNYHGFLVTVDGGYPVDTPLPLKTLKFFPQIPLS